MYVGIAVTSVPLTQIDRPARAALKLGLDLAHADDEI